MACYEYKGKKYTEQELKSVLQNEQPNTRRILEMQSDLFQKGRSSKNLVNNNVKLLDPDKYEKVTILDFDVTKKANIVLGTKDFGYSEVYEDTENYYLETSKVKVIKNEEFSEYIKVPKSSLEISNKFLQLLNKKGNWINFFIQGIVQDSLKKSYSKVLFPKGETAAKIEGHTLISDKIKELEKKKADYLNEELSVSNDLPPGSIAEKSIAEQREIRKNSSYVKQLDKEIEKYKTEGLEKLAPIEGFYENRVSNILNKLYDVNEVTDEYGNSWNEVILAQPKVSQEILLQKDEANRIIGQAHIDAKKILIDTVNQKQDTLPHEYAHHYIAMFRNTPMVQEGIKRFGSEEQLVQAIGEQVVAQEGEALNWWKKFVKFILDFMSDKEVLQVLTDSFLEAKDLNELNYGDSKSTIIQLSNAAHGKQMEVPNHIFNDEQKMAVQVRKNIIKDIDPERYYTKPSYMGKGKIKGKVLIKKFNELEIQNIKDDMEEVSMRFENLPDLVKMLQKEILRKGLDSRFLDLTKLDAEGNLELSLDHPAFIYQIRQVFNSLFTKQVIQQKLTNGVAYANASPFGFDSPKTVTKPDGSIDYYEAYAPISNSVLKQFVKKGEILDYDTLKERALAAGIDQQTIDKLVTGIVWRIPNEKVFSNYHIKVTKFFPSEMGASIVLPLEMTALSGAD